MKHSFSPQSWYCSDFWVGARGIFLGVRSALGCDVRQLENWKSQAGACCWGARVPRTFLPYNADVKSWDAIIIGGGIIGLSLALELRKRALSVLVIERGEPGREASHAAAGMLVGDGEELPAPLKPLAAESARMYPNFVHELEDESGLKIDFREQGTILISDDGHFPASARPVNPEHLHSMEPALAMSGARGRIQTRKDICAAYLPERSVDPRALMTAAVKAVLHREIDISSGSEVLAVLIESSRVTGVKTDKTSYSSAIVVNCAGAWASQFSPQEFTVRPVKGQMLAVVNGPPLQYVVRAEHVYLVPRSNGRIVIGSTLEEAGFDKQIDVDGIEKLFHAAVELVPSLAQARQHEVWAGLRPGTPDGLPIMGKTSLPGYYVATGHYRDGILLAPITAQALSDLIEHGACRYDLTAFAPSRFETNRL
jgi:glycine oxidase